jgi:hypothetical protein
MSNQRSFKIESFRFAAFVARKIEFLDRTKTFSISTGNCGPKAFVLVRFKKFFETTKSFLCLLAQFESFGFVFISFFKILPLFQ